MSDLVPVHGEILETGPGALPVPVLIADHGEDAWRRFIEFFTAQIRNANSMRKPISAYEIFTFWFLRANAPTPERGHPAPRILSGDTPRPRIPSGDTPHPDRIFI